MPLETVLLTAAKIEECESLARSYTHATVKLLGGEFHRNYPVGGWKQRLIGTRIPLQQFEDAKACRSKWALAAEKQKTISANMATPCVKSLYGPGWKEYYPAPGQRPA